MANQISLFVNPIFGQVRTVVNEQGDPLFYLKDVCAALGLKPSKVVQRLKDDVLSKYPISDNLGRTQMANFVNEDGLYDVTLDSRKPKAREFRKWITSEVVPQIRKTGGYIPVAAEDDDMTILAKAVKILERTVEKKDALLEAQKPQVVFAKAIAAGDGSILIGEMAKLLTQNGIATGRTRLFRWLRRHNYIFQKCTSPIQKWVEKGIFDTCITLVQTNHGAEERITTKVTGSGQEYFLNGFLDGEFDIDD